MSSGSLISSLFRDNSFASRSSSMFHKSFLGQEAKEERSRSQSAIMEKNANSNPGSRYLPVARMTHTLAVKVKKLNYFLFCRLEANLKKFRAENPSLTNKNIESEPAAEIFQQLPPAPKKQKSSIESIAKGLHSLAEIFQLNQLKQQNSICVESTFKKIKRYSQAKEVGLAVFKVLSRNYYGKLNDSFKCIHDMEKFALRAEIFSEATVHVIQPQLHKIFKKIRDLAIDNKIKLEMEDREKKKQQKERQKERQKEKEKFVNLDEFYLGTVNKRLKSIEEEGSSMISEEETARFATPEKSRSKKHKSYQEDLEKSKTSRKEAKIPVLTRKDTRKEYEEVLMEEKYQIPRSIKRSQQLSQSRINNHSIRSITKKHPPKPKLPLLKPPKLLTLLHDPHTIPFTPTLSPSPKESMLKHNRLYSQALPHMLPDLHDNMGVFEQMWADQSNTFSEDHAYSHRTVEKSKSQWIDIENSKTISHCREGEVKAVEEDVQRVSFYEIRNTQDVTFLKENADKNVVTASSRAMTNSLSSPKFCVETGINTSTVQKDFYLQENRQNRANNQFYSSPLYKIEQMMIDLQKLREREKFNSKYTSGYQKCKLSVNLPKKSYEGRSYQVSASKSNINSSKTGLAECRSEKKELRAREAFKRFSYKENNKEQKQNIQVKLWQQKEKFMFYAEPKSNKERKRSSGLISSMNQSQINTARKMKKEIENIINNRKSRTSLGALKLAKSKY